MEHKGQVIRHLSLAWVVQDPKNSFESYSAREWTELFSGATMGALEAPARPDLNRFDFAPGLDFSCCSATWRRVAERRPTGAEQGRGSLCGFPWKVRLLLLLGGALACWRLSVQAEVTRGRAGCSALWISPE